MFRIGEVRHLPGRVWPLVSRLANDHDGTGGVLDGDGARRNRVGLIAPATDESQEVADAHHEPHTGQQLDHAPSGCSEAFEAALDNASFTVLLLFGGEEVPRSQPTILGGVPVRGALVLG